MIETSAAWISALEPDLLRVEYKPDVFVDVAELEENLQAYRKLMKAEKGYFLIVANLGTDMSAAARNLYATKERASFKIAEAFVLASMAQRLIGSFVVRVQHPKHLIRFFNSEEEAKKWLYKVREKNGIMAK